MHRLTAHCRSFQGNYFFRLSRYQAEIEQLLSSEEFVQPAARRNEVGGVGRVAGLESPPLLLSSKECLQPAARRNEVGGVGGRQAVHPPSCFATNAPEPTVTEDSC